MPCTPARARMLLRGGKAAVLRRYPFTIILKTCSDGDLQPIELKADPGSKVTGFTVACEDCNQSKNNLTAAEFGHPNIQKQALRPLKDASAVNATHYVIGAALKSLGLPVSFWTGGRTKFSPTQQDYPKAHWIDAACVGESGNQVKLDLRMQVSQVKATGHGSRQMCRMDRFGFPRTSTKTARVVKGFRTGDIVRAVVPYGKKTGTYDGKVAVRASGSFNVSTATGIVLGISYKYCSVVHRADGYSYLTNTGAPLGNELPSIRAQELS